MSEDNSKDRCHCKGLESNTPLLIDNPPIQNRIKFRIGEFGHFKESMLVSLNTKNDSLNTKNDSLPIIIDPESKITSKHTTKITGTFDPMKAVKIIVNGKVIGKTTANENGEWEITVIPEKIPKNEEITVEPQMALPSLMTRANDDLVISTIESWAMLCDIITFYQERIANEGYLRTANERNSVLQLARTIGYELKSGISATAKLAFTLEDTLGSFDYVTIPKQTKIQSMPDPEGDGLPITFETKEDLEARPEWDNIDAGLVDTIANNQEDDFLKDNVFYFKGINLDLKIGRDLLVAKESASNQTTIHYKKIMLIDEYENLNITKITTINHLRTQTYPITIDSSNQGVFTFRNSANFFGHNSTKRRLETSADSENDEQWTDTKINMRSDLIGGFYNTENPVIGDTVYFDNIYPEIIPGNWVSFKTRDKATCSYIVLDAWEKSIADFGLSQKITGVKLHIRTDGNIPEFFTRRITSAAIQSERREISGKILPKMYPHMISEEISYLEKETEEKTLLINVEKPLDIEKLRERIIIISGKTSEDAIDEESEFKTIANIRQISDVSNQAVVTFTEKIEKTYIRSTIKINFNVIEATQGQTLEPEIIGSGDGSEQFQEFELKGIPLTYVPAIENGSKNSLEIRVNGALWEEKINLAFLNDKENSYIARLEDNGTTRVIFGDGKTGKRLPTGIENIKAHYRIGTGLVGNVQKNQLSLLIDKPFGVLQVNNPENAIGGADAEKIENARENAPLVTLTLNRLVSLLDFEDYARAYKGISKAHAFWIWDDQRKVVYLSLATDSQTSVVKGDSTYENLLGSMNKIKDPSIPIKIANLNKESFIKKQFYLNIGISVENDILFLDVKPIIEEKIIETYDFSQRKFGQKITDTEIIALVHSVKGVKNVLIKHLSFSNDINEEEEIIEEVHDVLPAKEPYVEIIDEPPKQTKIIYPAEIITLARNPKIVEIQDE